MSIEERIAEIEVRDLSRIAFHEAGHAAVLRHFGGVGSPRIWRNESGSTEEKAWLGAVRMFASPGLMPGAARAPDDWKVIVGLAGVVAEVMSEDPSIGEEDIAFTIDCFLEIENLSQTDAEMAGHDFTHEQIQRTFELLVQLWPHVEFEARNLIETEAANPASQRP